VNVMNVAYMALGAALVAIGVLTAALTDRIRGLRIVRERATALRQPALHTTAQCSGQQLDVVETATRSPAPRTESRLQQGIADEVIAALVAAGHKKPVATDAVRGCSEAERATIETWTRAALRRSARGGLS
jgi:hypothetical protein